ncbi:MAG: hypothetical protein ACE5K4_00990 [Candidatus Hydrothermarchaeota archaeon]
MFTVSGTISTQTLEVKPSNEIYLNGIVPSVSKVIKAYERVDLRENKKAAYLVEHILGTLRILNMYCDIRGISSFDPSRPSHRDAVRDGFSPSVVLGSGDGRAGGDVWRLLLENRKELREDEYFTIKNRVKERFKDGYIEIRPASIEDGLNVRVVHHDSSVEYNTLEKRYEEMLDARTPVLIGYCEEGLRHVVVDVLGDMNLERINAADIIIKPVFGYHKLTVSALKKAERIRI